MSQIVDALENFTRIYCNFWQKTQGHGPASAELLGVPSPCIIETNERQVIWQPQPFTLPATLDAIESAMNIRLQPDITTFYTTQFAGDMYATVNGIKLALLQVWSEQDFTRLQENLIGHLVMKRQLRQPPTLFIATLESEQELIALCNLSGAVVLEAPGSGKRQEISPDLAHFLSQLQPVSCDRSK